MSEIVLFMEQHASIAPWCAFFLILLAGLNIPISIDVTLICAGMIASFQEDLPIIPFFIVYAAMILAACESYSLGRFFGPRLYTLPITRYFVNREKERKMESFLNRFGFLTFLGIRFIPGGVRNVLFMTSDLIRLPVTTFLRYDIPAASISCLLLYNTGFLFAGHFDQITHFFHTAGLGIAVGLLILLSCILIAFFAKRILKN